MSAYDDVIKMVEDSDYPDVTQRAILCTLTSMREIYHIDIAKDIISILQTVTDGNEIIRRVFWRRGQSIRFNVMKTMQDREYSKSVRREIIKYIGHTNFEYGIDLGPQALLILYNFYDENEILERITSLFRLNDYQIE